MMTISECVRKELFFKLTGILSAIAILSWGMLIVSGVAPFTEMFLFNGRILHVLRPRLVFAFSLFFLLLIRPRAVPKQLLNPWCIFLAYLFCDGIYLKTQGLPFSQIWLGYKAYFSSFLLFPFFALLLPVITEDKLVKVFKVSFILLGTLALAQFFLNATVLPIESSDGFFKVWSWDFYHKVRVFSLFSSPSSFSLYLTVVFCMLTANLIAERKWAGTLKLVEYFVLLPSVLFLLYITYLRTGYVVACFSVVSFIFVYTPALRRRYFRFMPLISFCAGVVLVITLAFTVAGNNVAGAARDLCIDSLKVGGKVTAKTTAIKTNTGKFKFWHMENISVASPGTKPMLTVTQTVNSQSLAVRFAEWFACWDIATRDIKTFLFGTGYTQNDTGYILPFPIDNMYVAIFLQIGFIGLLFCLWYIWKMWLYMWQLVRDNPTPFDVALLSVFCGAIVGSFFNFIISEAFLWLVLVFLVPKAEKQRFSGVLAKT